MDATKVQTGDDFGRALSQHFSLPANQLLRSLRVNAEPNELLSVTLTLLLTPKDLAGIAELMQAHNRE